MKTYLPKVSISRERIDMPLLAVIRAALAISALAATLIGPTTPALPLFYVCSAYSVVLYILTVRHQVWFSDKLVLWIDVIWCVLLQFYASGDSYFSVIWLFAIAATALHRSDEAGRHLTVSCALILIFVVLNALEIDLLANALLPTVFLLGVGHMASQWAHAGIEQRRKLTMLVGVSKLSNPRFGVDHTIDNIMQLTAQFYRAHSCILVLREPDHGAWSIRTSTLAQVATGHGAQLIDDTVAAPFMVFGADQIIFFARNRNGVELCAALPASAGVAKHWAAAAPAGAAAVADLLDTNSFISVPVPLRSGAGRLYVLAGAALGKADAEFLSDIAAEAFPVIENIRLLDRLASNAAKREREKIAHDLHDSFLQPYIGLHHALRAILKKVDGDDPLRQDIDKLSEMTGNVTADLRQLADTIRHRRSFDEPAFLGAVRGHTERLRQFYGLSIAVHVDGHLGINDRMATEIFQIVCEGTSNIRKHTSATRGSVTLSCVEGWLKLRIENECADEADRNFMPRSICERAAALGGSTCVERLASGATAVRVDIPV